MSVQYLLVTFHEQRGVLADGVMVGVTNHILMMPADEYQISLDGTGYSPTSRDVPLDGTSLVKPLVVAFTATVGATSGVLAAQKSVPKRKRSPTTSSEKPLDDKRKAKKPQRPRKTRPKKATAKPSSSGDKAKKNA